MHIFSVSITSVPSRKEGLIIGIIEKNGRIESSQERN